MNDEQLIEAMARAMFKDDQLNLLNIAKAALAVCRPIIEAQERERCARIAEGRYWSSALGTDGIPKAIAAAIRETGDE